jgi:solute carrier family 25 S-adenosylmethionine transporter 26
MGVIGSCLLGQIPYAVLTFGSYEQYKRMIRKRFPKLKPVFAYAIAAVMGDVTGSGWLCPAEVIKQRLQAGVYETTGQAFAEIWKNKGMRGFYRGYFGGLARDVPYRVVQMTSYEMAKSLYIRLNGSRRNRCQFWSNDSTRLQLSPAESAILGGIAGCLSTVLTQPMDVLRTQMMTNSAAYGNSMLTCLQSIFHQHGLRGIYTGN